MDQTARQAMLTSIGKRILLGKSYPCKVHGGKNRRMLRGPFFLFPVASVMVGLGWQGFWAGEFTACQESEPRCGYVPESAAWFPVLCADVDVGKRDRD
jgi:hypothetical protein